MGLSFDFKVEGTEKLAKKLDAKNLVGPIKHILSKAGLSVQRQAMTFSPVDTGRLRSSFTTKLDTSAFPTWSKVGTTVEYAESLEYSGKSPRGVGRIPFFGPAIEAMKGKLDGFVNEAKQMIEQKWGK